jgi:hypothetical protein
MGEVQRNLREIRTRAVEVGMEKLGNRIYLRRRDSFREGTVLPLHHLQQVPCIGFW